MTANLASLRQHRHELILLVLVVLEWMTFNAAGPRFGRLETSFDIVRHTVEIGLLALALTPVILTGGIDLSVGSLLGLAAVVFGKLWRDAGVPVPVAIALTLMLGAAAGGLNAVLIHRLRLPPLIVTLGTFSLFRGLAEALTRGVDTFTDFPAGFLVLGQERLLGVPTQAWVLLAAIVFFWLLVHHTTYGRAMRVIGHAPEAARFAGLPVGRRIALVYVLAGVVSALAAIVYASRVGQTRADSGTGYELFAITAVVLGGTSIFGGTGSIPGTLLGVAAIAILNTGLVHARLPGEMAGVCTGILLILALLISAVPNWRRRPRRRATPVAPTPPAAH